MRKAKVEHLSLAMVLSSTSGRKMWTTEQLVRDYWSTKTESERRVVLLFPPTRAHGRH